MRPKGRSEAPIECKVRLIVRLIEFSIRLELRQTHLSASDSASPSLFDKYRQDVSLGRRISVRPATRPFQCPNKSIKFTILTDTF